jgi:pimeloyl-ACP methyl ester carboxylesterase
VSLPFDQVGEGTPIVLLHAGVADRRMWTEHLEPLSRAGYQAVAVDLPGFGEAPMTAVSPWDAVLAMMDELGVARAVLVGNSFGGGMALRAAAIAPDRVVALVLVSARPFDAPPSPQLAAAWEAEETALERGDVRAATQAVVEAWTQPGAPRSLRDGVAAMQRRAFELQLDVHETEVADPLAGPDDLGAVTMPTLVAAGEYDMPDFLEAAAELARALPNAERVTIEGAGHLAPLETPEAFREALSDFLTRKL